MVSVFVSEGRVGLKAGTGVTVIGMEVEKFGFEGIWPKGDPCRDGLAELPLRTVEVVPGRGEVIPLPKTKKRI